MATTRTQTKRAPANPTEEEILGSSKAELLKLIEERELDIETDGKRVGELRDALVEHFYPSGDEDEDEDDEDEEEEEAPPPKKKTTATVKKSSKKSDDDEDPDWEEILNQLNQGGDIFFVKDGRTQLRLVPEDPSNKKSFFHETSRLYRGQRRTKYLIRAFLPKLDPPGIKAVPVGPTVLKSILGLLAEGYELLDPEEGHGITIVRRGSGLDTSYNVMPSPKPVPMPEEFVDLETSLEEIAEQLEEGDVNRDKNREDEDDEEKPARGRRPARGKAKKDEDEDGEEW